MEKLSSLVDIGKQFKCKLQFIGVCICIKIYRPCHLKHTKMLFFYINLKKGVRTFENCNKEIIYYQKRINHND